MRVKKSPGTNRAENEEESDYQLIYQLITMGNISKHSAGDKELIQNLQTCEVACAQPDYSQGYFIAFRSHEAMELLEHYPPAFLLLYVIAYRARWRNGVGADGLTYGEAKIGDYEKCGLTEQNYRTAKQKLEKAKIATFRATNKGTIAKLCDRRIFSLTKPDANEQSNGQLTDKQRTANGQATTKNKKKVRKKEGEEVIDYEKCPPSVDEFSKLVPEEHRLSEEQKERCYHYYNARGWVNVRNIASAVRCWMDWHKVQSHASKADVAVEPAKESRDSTTPTAEPEPEQELPAKNLSQSHKDASKSSEKVTTAETPSDASEAKACSADAETGKQAFEAMRQTVQGLHRNRVHEHLEQKPVSARLFKSRIEQMFGMTEAEAMAEAQR